MTVADYSSIIEHYENCLAEHGDSHLGVDWPNARDANTRYGVMLDLLKDCNGKASLLDFGCGAAHLYRYLRQQAQHDIKYVGLDVSEKFIELSRRKYPENEYLCLDVLKQPDKLGQFDYVVMNGVFTEKQNLSFDQMFAYFKELVCVVFNKTNRGLAFNVMSSHVDWEREDLFHLPFSELMLFLHQNVSRHVVIRNDYGLYEYTVYVYQEANNV